MKKIVSLLLTVMILLSLAACGNSEQAPESPAAPSGTASTAPSASNPPPSSNPPPGETSPAAPEGPSLAADGRYPAELVKIGFVNYDTTADQVLAIQDYFKYLQTAFNFDVIWSESLSNAEQEFEFIERCAAAGCKAIIGYYNEGLDESAKLCASLGMYYWGGAEQDRIYEPNKNNDFYLGGYYSGNMNYDFGYAITAALVANDCHKVIVMSGGKDYGVPFFIERYQGIIDGIEKAKAGGYDIEMVYEVPGWPGTEEFAAHQVAALQTEADSLAGTLNSMMWLQPMQVAGKFGQIKIASIGTADEDMVGLMHAGVFVGVCVEISGVFGLAIPMILNAVDGYASQQRNADGTAPKVNVSNWVITSADDMAYFADIERPGGTWTFNIDDMKTVLFAFNPDMKVEDLSTLYTATSAEEVRARR